MKNAKPTLFWVCCICSLFLAWQNVFAATYYVTNTLDSGPGSLRQAILDARAAVGSKTIAFQIPLSDVGFNAIAGTWTIRPLSQLPELTSGSITIDGFSQSNFTGEDTNPLGPEIVIDGSLAGSNSDGFEIGSSGNTICGLVIGGFLRNGIFIETEGARDNRIWGNYIGIDASGSQIFGNVGGIFLDEGTRANVIGGTSPGSRNVISGNDATAIHIADSDSNRVIGNYIGTDASGTLGFFPNAHGMHIANGSSHNEIGGLGRREGNLISGHGWDGIQISDEETQYNTICGNLIGTDASGLYAIHNSTGIRVSSASNNTIGPHNTICFSSYNGIDIDGGTARFNRITQNCIYGNQIEGIRLEDGGNEDMPSPVLTDVGSVVGTAQPLSTVEIFSDSSSEGRLYEGTVTADASGNFIWIGTAQGPYVTATATDANGNTSMFSEPMHLRGWIVTRTDDDYTEGSLPWAIWQAENHPGADTITFAIPMTDPGFDGLVWRICPQNALDEFVDGYTFIDGLSQAQNIGDTNPNGPEIMLDGTGLLFDDFGLNIWSPGNTIRGLIVSGFPWGGIDLYGIEARGNRIIGNFIGTDSDGTGSLGNYDGIIVQQDADSNLIGGPGPGEGNLISGNLYNGISVYRADSCFIFGNTIGLDRAGTADLGNGSCGIDIERSSANLIGGTIPGEGNLISGNDDDGINFYKAASNRIFGNIIGLDRSGTMALGNGGYGIDLLDSSYTNRIGSYAAGEENVISGNLESGIRISESYNTMILGNRIGTDIHGTTAIGNTGYGIYIYYSSSNTIGGTSPDSGNVISGNLDRGIYIRGAASYGNRVAGNAIGTDFSGTHRLSNLKVGVRVSADAHDNVIGPGNMIRYNGEEGVLISGASSLQNRITQNSICGNLWGGITLSSGGNYEIGSPELTSVGPVTGTAPPYSTVEIFSDSSDQGRVYEGTVTADANGDFSWAGNPQGPQVTATATDLLGNTSKFSESLIVLVDGEPEAAVPKAFFLSQNYPNPFNPTTTITYGIEKATRVRLTVIDLSGREIAVLTDGMHQPGYYEVIFDAKDLASGIYICRIQTDRVKMERKMVVVK